MTDKAVSDLLAATSLNDADLLLISQSGVSKKLTASALKIYAGGGTVTSISGTGTVSGLTLSGTVTTTGNLTLSGTLNLSSPPAIGGTTPAAGTFTSLTANGNTILGDASADTVTFNAATVTLNNSTTISAASTKTLTLNGGAGSNGLVLDASNNVGIGTSSPSAKLDVSGFIKTTSGAVFQGSSNSATGAGLEIGYNGSNQGFIQSFNRSASTYQPTRIIGSQILFDLSNTVSMTLDSSGNLGLGVTPSAWGSGQVALQIGADASFMATKTGADLNISSNAYYDGTNWRYIRSSVAASNYYQTLGTHVWRYAPSGTAGNPISFTQAMTLDASGNLLLGGTSSAGSYLLQISGNFSGTYGQLIKSSASSGYMMSFNTSSGQAGYISSSGTSTSYVASSDQRLKENIVDAPSALSSVNAIKVRSFDWKADGSHVDYGYIAQELLEVAPEAVHAPADPEEMMGVDFGKLTPRLVKAIQELSAELNELKQKVNA